MAGPGDETAVGARGHLRASHADREQVIEALKAAFIQGRLAKAELDVRVGQALAARTYADLAALTADLPVGLDAVPLPRAARVQARRPVSKAAKAGICAVLAVVVAVIASIPTGGAFLFVFAPFYFMALVVAGWQMLDSRHDKRARGQPPPGRAPGVAGQASRRLPPADPGRQLPPDDPGPQHTAEAAPAGRPRLQPS
jgi:DUF1707 SHOCT-like domain